MAARIQQAMGINPELIPGTKGVFDVVVDDELVYSKFKTGSFPDEDQLVSNLIAASGNN